MIDVGYKLASFLETADKIIYEKEKGAIRELREYILTGGSEKYLETEIRIPMLSISELVNCMEAQNPDVIKILDFFRALSKDIEKLKMVDALNMYTLDIDVADVKDIHPKYIKDLFMKKYKEGCSEIAAGKNIKKEIDKIRDPNYLKGLRTSTIVSTVPDYLRNGDICRLMKTTLKRLTSSNINEFISFLEQYTYDRLPYFTKKVKEIKNVEKECSIEMRDVAETMMRIGEKLKTPDFLINRYIYTQEMTYLELMKYTLAMTMHSINAWIKKFQVISQCYDILKSHLPDLITENPVLEYGDDNPSEFGNLLDGEKDSVKAFEPRVYEAIVSLHKWMMVEFQGIKPHELSDPSYPDIDKCLTIFSDGLKLFQSKLKDEEFEFAPLNSIISDCLLGECDWKNVLKSSIQKIRKMGFLKDGGFSDSVILRDLEVMREYFTSYSDKLLQIEEQIRDLKQEMSINPNEIYRNSTRVDDAMKFLDKVMDSVVSIGRAITKSFEIRIHHVECKLRTPEPMDVNFDWHDFAESYIDTMMESSIDLHEKEILSMENDLLQYYITRSASPFSSFFEEGEENKENGEEKKNDTNEKENEKNDLKPKVTGATNEEKKDEEGNKDTENDSNGSVKEKLKEAIDKLIKMVNDFITGDGQKNKVFLDTYETDLLSVNCDGLAMQIVPYENESYNKMVLEIITKASKIDDSLLKSGDQEQIEKYLFSHTEFSSIQNTDKSEKTTKEKLIQAFKVKNKPLKLESFSGDKLSQEIKKMIDFCRYYHETLPKDLSNLKSKLDDAALTNILEKKGNGENDNTSKNTAVIRKALDDAINAMVTAARSRSNDYILVLDEIAEKTGLKKKAKKEEKKAA